ncbi:MAG: SRPBCC domain-containing protein, partial [Chloroflexi bacterium]|nr:SRPBCC domain-containing protein [Chloroflexota bacterium]
YTIKRVVRATPKRLFEAWLDSREHSDMTGRAAKIDSAAGGGFTTLDGLVTGENLEAEPYHRIVQSWTASAPGTPPFDSRVEIVLSTLVDSGAIANAHDDGATVTVGHSGLPPGQSLFNAGWWEDNYFQPMDAYFALGRNGFMRPSDQMEPQQNG